MKHAIDKHESRRDVSFKMKVINKYSSAFPRMVGEAVRINRRSESKTAEILNSKSEYSRCKIPRLMVTFGGEVEDDEKRIQKGKNERVSAESSSGGSQSSRCSPSLDEESDKGESKVCCGLSEKKISAVTANRAQLSFQSSLIQKYFDSGNADQDRKKRKRDGVT